MLQSSLPSGLATYYNSITNIARFIGQAVYQHVETYPTLVGVSGFNTEYGSILSAHKPSTAVTIDPIRSAIQRVIGVDVGDATHRAAPARRG